MGTGVAHERRFNAQAGSAGRAAVRPLAPVPKTPKGILSAAFLALLAIAGTAAGWATVLPHVAVAMGGAALVDLLVQRVEGRGVRWPSSALLSGLIVAFVLGPDTALPITLAIGGLRHGQ